MLDVKDFLKLDKYLRHFLAQYYSDAINLPFGGLNIVLFGDFSQLNPIGRDVIYDCNINALRNLLNRVIILLLEKSSVFKRSRLGKKLTMNSSRKNRERRC
jgi:hypothetical protein